MCFYNRAAMKAFFWSPVTILLVIVVCVLQTKRYPI